MITYSFGVLHLHFKALEITKRKKKKKKTWNNLVPLKRYRILLFWRKSDPKAYSGNGHAEKRTWA